MVGCHMYVLTRAALVWSLESIVPTPRAIRVQRDGRRCRNPSFRVLGAIVGRDEETRQFVFSLSLIVITTHPVLSDAGRRVREG